MDGMSDTDVAGIAIALALIVKKKKKRSKRKWMNEVYRRRVCTPENVLNETDLTELSELMDANIFNQLLEMISPAISKQNTLMREAIPASQRLRITLKFLATGKSFGNLTLSCAISTQSISSIVMETCHAIINALSSYMKLPKSNEQWISVAEDFYKKCYFPNCLGAVDGMHVAINKPQDGLYFNYKKFFSIVLIAVVNANYEFITVDASTNGYNSDSDILSNINFGKSLAENKLHLPQKRCLPNTEDELRFVFVGSDAFALKENFLRPYSETEAGSEELICNYRLNNVQRIAENTLGVLVSKFGVLQFPICLSPDKTRLIVITCCYLHNFLKHNQPETYFNPSYVDSENVKDGSFFEGSWRGSGDFVGLQAIKYESMSSSACAVRDGYCHFFNNEGQLPWQNKFVEEKSMLL